MINNNKNINNKSNYKDIMNSNINNPILQTKSKSQIHPTKKERSFSSKIIIDYNKIKKINEPKNSRNINIIQYYINTNKINSITKRISYGSELNLRPFYIKKANNLNNKNNNKYNNKKINYSIFINISNIEKKSSRNISSELYKIRNNFIYMPFNSKKKLSQKTLCSFNIHLKEQLKYKNTKYFYNRKNSDIYSSNTFSNINNYKTNLKSIIFLQSFIRRYLIRNKIYKNLILSYKIEESFKHINKYIESYLIKSDLLKIFMNKIKKNVIKKYFVNKEQYELIKLLKEKNVHNFNEFKNFVIWCINNNINEI